MERSTRRGTKRSRAIRSGNRHTGGGGGLVLLVGIIIVLGLPLLYLVLYKGQSRGAPQKGEEAATTEDSTQKGGEESAVERKKSPPKTYFTREEWEEVRKVAEKAIGLMNRTKIASEA